ncbi:MAG: hypothetical protein ACE5DO_11285, partial [Desulfobacterales bacterium]
ELPVDLKNVTVQKTTTSKIASSGIRDTIQRHKELSVKVKYSYKTILTIAATALATFLLTWFLKPGPPLPKPKPANRMVVQLPDDIDIPVSGYNKMAISPNGTNMVFIATGAGGGTRLFLKRAGSFITTELAGTNGARGPFFSPDGRWIGYFHWAAKEIKKILIDGGQPFKITSYKDNRSSATCAPDNTIIFTEDGVLKRISDVGGESTVLTKIKREGEWHQFPRMLPDGKTVLFTVRHEGNSRLAVYRLEDDDYRVILEEEGYNAVYSPTGHILYGRSGRLMAVPFDLKNLRISGIPALVLDNVQTFTTTGGMSYAFSEEGTIIYVPGSGTDEDSRSVVNVDLSGKASAFFDLTKQFRLARYSPDGRYVGFVIREENDSNIWIYQIDGGVINQLTFYKGGVNSFVWAPDSKTVAYATEAEDSTNSIYVKKIDGSGTAQKIFTSSSDSPIAVRDWSRNGDKIAIQRHVGFGNVDILVFTFQDSSAKPYLSSAAREVGPSFSPNGKWLLYSSNESGGSEEVYVRPYPESSGGVWKISDGAGSRPRWSPDGKKIYYRRQNAEMYSVDVTATDLFSKGTPKKLFDETYFVAWGTGGFDVHPDGDRFLMIQSQQFSQQSQNIFVIENFFEEIERLVPVGRD